MERLEDLGKEAKKGRLKGGRKKKDKGDANQKDGERMNTKERTGGNGATMEQKVTTDKDRLIKVKQKEQPGKMNQMRAC